MGYIILFHFVCSFVCLAKSGNPPGHLQIFGSHRPGIKVEKRLTVPDPAEFFEKYVKLKKPVVFKEAAKKFPNFETWKDDNYLRSKYGNWFSTVETRKYEGGVTGEIVKIPLRFFLNHYKTRYYYIIEDIAPENPMRNDIYLLKSMSCGSYKETINKVVLLFSSGGTECAMHWDAVDNIHCIMDGTKEWRMFESKALEVLPRMKDHPAYSEFDCRKIDMYKYPMVQDLPWYHAVLETGDCLYVPPNWPHYVKSPQNRRNMGLGIWFGPTMRFNKTDCPQDMSALPDLLPIGKRFISKMDYAVLHLSSVFGTNLTEISNEGMIEEFTEYLKNETTAIEATNALDADKNGFVTWSEVMNIKKEFQAFFTSLLERPSSVYTELAEDWTTAIHDEL